MELDTIGIDLGKTVFHLVGLSRAGEVVVRRKFSRTQLLRFTANLRMRLIGMEACGGSHFLGRSLREQGHEVRLMPAQYVKPYVKTNKNDYVDAEVIAEAVGRANMRFAPIKSNDQLDMQSLHRVRDRWVARRTSVVNQMRGLLLERGITFRKGRRHAQASLPGVLEDPENGLSGLLRMLLAQLQGELRQLQSQIDEADALIAKAAREQEACQRLMAIPGVGPLTATAVVASIGSGAEFRKGRSFAAWLGLVPKQESTGGRQKLLSISKRGNHYLRRLFVSGARAVLQCRDKQSSGLSAWLGQLASRVHTNVAAVALANKMARVAWAVLAKSEAYRPPLSVISTEALVCWANSEMAKWSNPALSKPVFRKSPSRLPNYLGRERSAFHQGPELRLTQRPDTFAQTQPPIFTFRLQQGGGPYIPDSRSYSTSLRRARGVSSRRGMCDAGYAGTRLGAEAIRRFVIARI